MLHTMPLCLLFPLSSVSYCNTCSLTTNPYILVAIALPHVVYVPQFVGGHWRGAVIAIKIYQWLI
jgi:hypothetical protein